MQSDPEGWRRISPNLYWYRDTCNVYMVRDGERGLLVDFGAGAALDRIGEVGVREIEWVVHTHHHRDQCQGDATLNARGIPIAVPAREAALFADVDAFWRLRKLYDQYDVSSVAFSLPRPIAVARRLDDYERFEWRGYSFEVVPTPGHTRGSISLLTQVDRRSIAFTGDLIAGHGVVHSIHDLQWQYGMPDAVGAALHSLSVVRDRAPDLLLPSHGDPVSQPWAALEALDGNLRRLYDLQREMRMSRVWNLWPHAVDQPKEHVLPHLWANPHSVANTYALLADDGRAMFMDYGFPSWDHTAADYRFVEHSIGDLQAAAGFERIDVVVPSHYHDDHLAGVPHLQSRYATKAWVFDNFVELLEEPSRFNLPCLFPRPIRVDRTLADRESFEWGGYRLTAFHMPGHTWYALGLFMEVDGTRVALVGDNMLLGSLGHLRLAGPVYRNVMPHGSVALGAERLAEFQPDLILTGHTGALTVEPGMLDYFIRWARDLDDAHMRLVAVPSEVGFALDPYVARIDPYHARIAPGDPIELRVLVTNHGDRADSTRVHLELPSEWAAEPRVATREIASRETLAFPFRVSTSAATEGRVVFCADVRLGSRRLGQYAEAIVDLQG